MKKNIVDFFKYKIFISDINLNHSIIMDNTELYPSDAVYFCYLFDKAKEFDKIRNNNELKSVLLNDLSIALRNDNKNYFKKSRILEHITPENDNEFNDDPKYLIKLHYFMRELDKTEYIENYQKSLRK